MKISKSHKKFTEYLGNPRALDHPEEFLGKNWKNVLNFWIYLDTLSDKQLEIVQERYCELIDADRIAAWAAARAAVTNFVAAWAARAAVANFVVGWATRELMGSDRILSQNKSLTFLPMFLDL